METQRICSSFLFISSTILLITTTTHTGPTQNDHISEVNAILASGQRQGRWGMFWTYEPVCTVACRKNGKVSGRMYGGICRCYCPRTETDPCKGLYPSCDRLCRQNSYHLGGDCVDEKICYCFCTVKQRQSPNSTVSSTTLAPCGSSTGQPPAPPAQAPVPIVPAPGSLGLEGG